MALKNKLAAIFILLRPYSLPGLFLLYYLAKIVVTHSLGLNIKYLIMFLPVFFAWTYLTLFLEAEHKHSNREKISYYYPAAALIITILLSVAFGGTLSLIPIAFFLLFTYLYVKKNNISILGKTSFIMRGFMETSLFFISLSLFSNIYLQFSTVLLGIGILLITSARNLLGDIRDTKFDTLTFTAQYGDNLGYVVSIVLYSIGAYILFILSGNIGIIFPILVMIFLLFVINNGHMFHRLSVLLSTIIISMYILFLSGNSELIFLVNIIFLSIVCNIIFYNLVPRRSNPPDILTIVGIVPWTKTNSRSQIYNKTKKNAVLK